MPKPLAHRLAEFNAANRFDQKGRLSVALVVTRHAGERGLPIAPDDLVTSGKGQVLGLGKGAVQAILLKHGISRVLAEEGGRTSRGSMGNMRIYVEFLNGLHADGLADLTAIEDYWISRVQAYFQGKPFKINLDTSKSVRAVVRDVIAQARERQRKGDGTQYVGAMMQHLIGAKLDCVLGKGKFEHNSFSTSDVQTGRPGDFFLGDVAMHATTSPGEAVIKRCEHNLSQGYRSILITVREKVAVAEGLADNAMLGERIDIFEVEQFLASNLHELGNFASAGRKAAIEELVTRYNDIIDVFETDVSMKIDLAPRRRCRSPLFRAAWMGCHASRPAQRVNA